MKHVFYIQSNITYLISLSIIKALNLKEKDVRFLVREHFYKTHTFQYKTYEYESEFRKLFTAQPFYKRILNESNQYINFDEKITKFVDNQHFIIYLPNVFSTERQALINHKLCKQVNFTEEGLMIYSYTDTYKQSFLNNLTGLKKITASISRKLFYYGRRRQFAPIHFFDTSVINKKLKPIYYSYSELGFSKYTTQKPVVLEIEALNKDSQLPENSHVITLDSLAENQCVGYDAYITSVKKIITELSEENIYLKFHPLQSEKIIDEIINFCKKKNININIIEKEIILEDYIINSKNLKFYGHISSLLFYAQVMGNHIAKTYIDDFLQDEKFLHYLSQQQFDLKNLLTKTKPFV